MKILKVLNLVTESWDMLLYLYVYKCCCKQFYSGADKSLARQGRKQATATEDFDVRVSYL